MTPTPADAIATRIRDLAHTLAPLLQGESLLRAAELLEEAMDAHRAGRLDDAAAALARLDEVRP